MKGGGEARYFFWAESGGLDTYQRTAAERGLRSACGVLRSTLVDCGRGPLKWAYRGEPVEHGVRCGRGRDDCIRPHA
jgi:hypothetical protein